MVPGVVAQGGEGQLHVEAGSLGDHTLGLLNDDPAVEGVLELLVEDLGFEGGAVLEDGNSRDVSQGLGRLDVVFSHLARVEVEQVEGADDGATQAHGKRVYRADPGGERLPSEPGPASVDLGQVLVHNGPAAHVTVQARAFPGLQLEQFQQPHGLTGRRHHSQVAVGPDQHEPGRVDTQYVNAAVGQQGEQLHHVELRHQRVGQLNERPGE